jgi:hypothetical protein
MSNYTEQLTIGPVEFDGDSVTIVAEQMDVMDMELIAPFVSDDGKVSFSNSLQLIKIASEILPDRVLAIQGLTVGGKEVTKEEFVNSYINKTYFMELTSEIVSRMIEGATLTKDQEGN